MNILNSACHKYYVLFLDITIQIFRGYFLCNINLKFILFQKLRDYVKTQSQRETKTVQCDNGDEYASNNFKKHV
jgi:hypothetical protein